MTMLLPVPGVPVMRRPLGVPNSARPSDSLSHLTSSPTLSLFLFLLEEEESCHSLAPGRSLESIALASADEEEDC